jgi:Leucine-rich repeat (LRR) protein
VSIVIDPSIGQTGIVYSGLQQSAGPQFSPQSPSLPQSLSQAMPNISPFATSSGSGRATRVETDEGLRGLGARRANLERLNLQGSRVSDEGMRFIVEMGQLRELNLANTQIGDTGIISLSNNQNLQRLDLTGTPITNAGLASLARLENLHTLLLANTPITDAGLLELRGMRNLRELDVSRCAGITPAGIRALQTAIPTLTVFG